MLKHSFETRPVTPTWYLVLSPLASSPFSASSSNTSWSRSSFWAYSRSVPNLTHQNRQTNKQDTLQCFSIHFALRRFCQCDQPAQTGEVLFLVVVQQQHGSLPAPPGIHLKVLILEGRSDNLADTAPNASWRRACPHISVRIVSQSIAFSNCIYWFSLASGIMAEILMFILGKNTYEKRPGSLEAKGFWPITSRRRMMSWRAEKRTWRFRCIVDEPARENPG